MPVSLDKLTELSAFVANQEGMSSLALAEALDWPSQDISSKSYDGQMNVSTAFLEGQPAAVFAMVANGNLPEQISAAALFAYQRSAEWGLIASQEQLTIFNSHWVKRNDWYSLPAFSWDRVQSNLDLLEGLTPQGVVAGSLERVSARFYEPDRCLQPIDEALVERLDFWRDEALRYTESTENVDEAIHLLFAQFFVLRAAEDRGLARQVPTLSSVLGEKLEVDLKSLHRLFQLARTEIQSELFTDDPVSTIPSAVISGIIRDLYYPNNLPSSGVKYDFGLIDADILGRAYEKYLSTLVQGTGKPPAQIGLLHDPYQEVARKNRRRSFGIYYTPQHLVNYLATLCVDRQFSAGNQLPRVVDFSCGSGSFLVATISYLIQKLNAAEGPKNWGKELVRKKCIVGIDRDPRAVTLARLSVWLRLAEEPNPFPLPKLEQTIVLGDALDESTWANLPTDFDIVLGNPPFLPFGAVKSREELAERFETAQGRFDFSYLFVELAVKKLKVGGVLGLVIPNRLYRNKDADKIREILTREGRILAITDFGTNEVFKRVNAYIGTLVVEKGSDAKDSFLFTRVLQLPSRFVGAALKGRSGTAEADRIILQYQVPQPIGGGPWLFLSTATRSARLRFEDYSELLESHAGVFQGIKAGANDLYVVTTDESESPGSAIVVVNGLRESHLVETALLKPVVYGSEIQEYSTVQPQRFLIYPYRQGRPLREEEIASEFPHMWNYFAKYKQLLQSRSGISDGSKDWYELVRPRDERWLSAPKLVMRDLALKTSFAIDPNGTVFLIGGTAIVPENPDLLLPLLAYLNSGLINWFLSPLTPGFRSEFQKYEPQHLSRLPVLKALLEDNEFQNILAGLARAALEARQAEDEKAFQTISFEIDSRLSSIVGVDPKTLF